MILRVILKNFLSFNQEVQFDMFPNMKRTSLSGHIKMRSDKLPVLKMLLSMARTEPESRIC